jgi:hypothetical protein
VGGDHDVALVGHDPEDHGNGGKLGKHNYLI